MVSAGEPLNPGVIAAWRDATGLEIADGYGQTETGHLAGNHVGAEIRPGSMGKPLPGVELRLADGVLELRPDTARPSSAAIWTRSRSPASGGRPATSCARTTTATSGTRAATTT